MGRRRCQQLTNSAHSWSFRLGRRAGRATSSSPFRLGTHVDRVPQAVPAPVPLRPGIVTGEQVSDAPPGCAEATTPQGCPR